MKPSIPAPALLGAVQFASNPVLVTLVMFTPVGAPGAPTVNGFEALGPLTGLPAPARPPAASYDVTVAV